MLLLIARRTKGSVFIASSDYFFENQVYKKWARVFLIIALCMAFFVTAVMHYPKILNLPVKVDSSSRLRGWEELGTKVQDVYNDMTLSGDGKVFIFSDKYQVSSELAFYMPSQPVTYSVNLGRRMNQYDIWGGLNDLLGLDAIFVTIGNGNMPERLAAAFDSYEKEKFTVMEGDRVLRVYSIIKCYGFKGLKQVEIGSY